MALLHHRHGNSACEMKADARFIKKKYSEYYNGICTVFGHRNLNEVFCLLAEILSK